jgi:hypothetical protein
MILAVKTAQIARQSGESDRLRENSRRKRVKSLFFFAALSAKVKIGYLFRKAESR